MRKALLLFGLVFATSFLSAQTFIETSEITPPADAGALKAISFVDADVVWLGDDLGNVYKSGDGGTSWSKLTTTPLAPTNGDADVMALVGVSNGEAYVATSNSVFRFHTMGLFNSEVLTDDAAWFNKVEVMSNGDAWVFGDDPGDGNYDIRVTTDDGSSWDSLATEPATGDGSWGWSNAVFKLDDNHMWFGTNSDDVFYTADGGATWSVSNIPSGTYVRHLAFKDANNGVAGTQDGEILTTTDGGATWTAVATDASMRVYVFHAGGSNYVAASGDIVMHSDDAGASWSTIYTDTDGGAMWDIGGVVNSDGTFRVVTVSDVPAMIAVAGSPQHLLGLDFEGDLTDDGALGLTVAESGGTGSFLSDAMVGTQAFEFDTTDANVLKATSSAFNSAEFSAELWFKPYYIESTSSLFGFMYGGGWSDYAFNIYYYDYHGFRFNFRDSEGATYRPYSRHVIEDGQWHHILIEFRSDGAIVEIRDENDVAIERQYVSALAGKTLTSADYIAIGTNGLATPRGMVDGVNFYKGVEWDLTPNSFPDLASATETVFPEGIEYYYEPIGLDPDGDDVTFVYSNLPAWLTQDGLGLRGTAPNETGAFDVQVTDGTDTTAPYTISYSTSSAVELYVATDGDDVAGDGSSGAPYATIEKAFSEIAPGGEVILMPGRHDAPNNLAWPVENLTFRGQTNAAECVIDGASQTADRIFTDLKGGATVDSIRFVNCAAPSDGSEWRLFNINGTTTSPFEVKNSVFDSCGSAASNLSGLWYGENGAQVVLDIHHNVFSNGFGTILCKNHGEVHFNNNTVDNWDADQTFADGLVVVYSYNQPLVELHCYNNIFQGVTTKSSNSVVRVHIEQDGRDAKLFSGCNLFNNNTATDTVEALVKDGRAFSEVDQYYAAYNKFEDPGLTDPANGDYTIASDASAAVDGGLDVGYTFVGFFPDMGAIESDFVTPVELTTFEAKAGDNAVTLSWATGSEVENRGFAIERRYEDGDFEKIGFVASAGATGANYSFVDQAASKAGVYTYRLKQIDLDGAFRYSRSVEVEVGTPNEFALDQNFPNPFNPSTTIRYELAQDVQVKLAVYNSIGEQIATLVNAQQAAGRYDVSFNASSFSSGIYFYRLEAGDFVDVKRMLLLK